MKFKEKPESKIPTTKTNTNKKRGSEVRNTERKIDASLLKKNEFALIIIGALLLTIIIFFLFFRSSGPKIEPVKKGVSNTSFVDLEKRIENIEQALQLKGKPVQSELDKTAKDVSSIEPIKDRVARLETAFSVKFDSLIERMGKIEKSIFALKNKPVATVKPKTVAKPKSVTPVKKAMKKEKKASMFHTVQKGETLYSISKKYNTSIATLRKLNNLSTNAKIYPGNNILVR